MYSELILIYIYKLINFYEISEACLLLFFMYTYLGTTE